MSEITKLYENAGIETNKYKLCCTGCKHIAKLKVINGYPSKWICDKYDEVADCDRAEPEYPPFTAEKQIELIEWIIGKYNEVSFSKRGSGYNICIDDGSFIGCHHNDKALERCLAGDINLLWQDLTEEEKQQVKGILE